MEALELANDLIEMVGQFVIRFLSIAIGVDKLMDGGRTPSRVTSIASTTPEKEIILLMLITRQFISVSRTRSASLATTVVRVLWEYIPNRGRKPRHAER